MRIKYLQPYVNPMDHASDDMLQVYNGRSRRLFANHQLCNGQLCSDRIFTWPRVQGYHAGPDSCSYDDA